ncbi:protein-methionine-sulfoxide reductase catalytic subunit MsrP [Elongatibacter sediminis]|uniref:Protein-methionine-sulfoxide reductase catalytic subunit MsrP n=1 Tax=Elongatibacter sediminis TaxID=3119006 RepID=A0AAW9RH80_9GAMM
MAHIRTKKIWEHNAPAPTDETAYWRRREFLSAVGLAGLAGTAWGGIALAGSSANIQAISDPSRPPPGNFVEFSAWHAEAAAQAQALDTRDWPITIDGLVEHPLTLQAGDLIAGLQQEERSYRFRCIEGWSATVPWTGFPLRALLERVKPLSGARYVRFESFNLPEIAPVQASGYYSAWPYGETLSLREAAHELTFLASGVYGKPLPTSHGAPLRLVVPWKYATKSVKSITRIRVLDTPLPGFWETNRPSMSDPLCNVDPNYAHTRIPQHQELCIGTGEWRETLPLNGYAEWVNALYV